MTDRASSPITESLKVYRDVIPPGQGGNGGPGCGCLVAIVVIALVGYLAYRLFT